MFFIYKKIASPETSPVLGPATPPIASPSKGSPTIDASCNDVVMEPFSLYSCCCGSRTAFTLQQQQQQQQDPQKQDQTACIETKYEFGHATHYTYNATTPRLIHTFETFETGTPP